MINSIENIFVIRDTFYDNKKMSKYDNLIKNNVDFIFWDKANVNMEDISEMVSNKCKKYCNEDIIQDYITNLELLNHIVENKLENNLIIKHSANIVPGFEKKLPKIFSDVPDKWDIIYLGCLGSCNNQLLFGKNRDVNDSIFIPKYPLGTFGMLISLNGAKKIYSNLNNRKIGGYYDVELSNLINKKIINGYVVKNQLVKLKKNPIANHFVGYSGRNNNFLFNRNFLNFPKVNYDVKGFTIILVVMFVILSILLKQENLNVAFLSFLFIQLVEMGLTKSNPVSLIAEITLVALTIFFTKRLF